MLNNRNAILIFRALMISLLCIIVLDLLFSQLSGSIKDFAAGHRPAVISGITALLLTVLNPRYFSFVDDHELIHIQSSSGLWSIFEHASEVNYTLPKSYIKDYEVTGKGLKRKLTLALITPYRGSYQYSFKMALLNSKQVAQIESALDKILKSTSKHQKSDLANVV